MAENQQGSSSDSDEQAHFHPHWNEVDADGEQVNEQQPDPHALIPQPMWREVEAPELMDRYVLRVLKAVATTWSQVHLASP